MTRSRSRLTRRGAAAVLCTTAVALTGCMSTEPEARSASGVPLVSEDTLTICTNTPYAPFEFEEGGRVIGFDMDLGREIADDLEVEDVSVIQTGFEGMESGADLSTNKCDVAISGIGITEARASVLDFSEPYYQDGLGVLVREGSPIRGLEDIGDARVAVQQATSGEAYATEHELNLEQQEDVELMLQKLETDGVEAVIGNVSVLGYRAKDNPDLVLHEDTASAEPLGVAIRLGNTAMVDSVNATLQRMDADGTMAELEQKWMGQ